MIERSRYGTSSTASDRARVRYHREMRRDEEAFPGERAFGRWIDKNPREALILLGFVAGMVGAEIAWIVFSMLTGQVGG